MIERAPDNTLRVTIPDNRCGMRVEVLAAFPLSHPEENIVLRDGKGQELGVLHRLSEVPEEARTLLREELRRRYFLPRITKIHNIQERFGSSVWEVDTDRGPCQIVTAQMNEAVHELKPSRYLITDSNGSRYEIVDLRQLDMDSQARFFGKV